MAGFLSALSYLAPIGQTLGPQMQIGARQAELEQQRTAFGKMLDQLGPEYEPFRQYYKAGGTPHEVSAAIGGPIGEQLRQQHTSSEINRIMNDPTLSPAQRNQQLFASNLISGESFMKSLTTPEAKTSANMRDFLAFHGLTMEDFQKKPDAEKKALQDQFEQFVHPKTAGAGDAIEWKPLYDEKTGQYNLTAIPKAAPVGTIIGQMGPKGGGANPVQEMAATKFGFNQLSSMIDKLPSGQKIPTWGEVVKMRAGLPLTNQMVALVGQMSVIGTNLTGLVARAWGTRNIGAVQDFIRLHTPQAGDSPALAKQKLEEWTRPGGYLDQYGIMIGTVPQSGPPMGGGGAPGGPPNDWENTP